MPRSVSPPISPKTVRQPKRSRQLSQSELVVEELAQDDLGYDADVEVLRPDQYEEAESDFEDDTRAVKSITAIDEEITRGMRQLGWRQTQPTVPTEPVTEHFSDLDSSPINQYGKRTEFHLTTPTRTDGRDNYAPPAKRRKRRESRLNPAQRILKSRPQPLTDSSDRTDEKRAPLAESSSTRSTVASDEPRMASNDEMLLD
ncbi:uncharacterized protein AB675_7788 [Cyphellophora attinorum]|uniref:Uncharacterized protein n=1 Tax=Cyphellophora attinorum TaxID=1664694 RepID=A0A0N0NMB0_9EURO|nr:uncharacterized protein AB675_7788 [Phialophora attinorum]KPI40241.1 hypothetical protein AB675_7788 [Phialophora attinorum]